MSKVFHRSYGDQAIQKTAQMFLTRHWPNRMITLVTQFLQIKEERLTLHIQPPQQEDYDHPWELCFPFCRFLRIKLM